MSDIPFVLIWAFKVLMGVIDIQRVFSTGMEQRVEQLQGHIRPHDRADPRRKPCVHIVCAPRGGAGLLVRTYTHTHTHTSHTYITHYIHITYTHTHTNSSLSPLFSSFTSQTSYLLPQRYTLEIVDDILFL